MSIQHIVNRINPKQLFLVDSIGALISAVMLGIVLTYFEGYIGMPVTVLQPLSLIASFFCIYSFVCFSLNPRNYKPYLIIIAIDNLIYCGISLFLMIKYHESLTALGFTYFILEKLIVLALAITELKVALKKVE
jgi:hypothetical protein